MSFLRNLLLSYLTFLVARIAFLFGNWTALSSTWPALNLWSSFEASARFDASAMAYLLLPWAALVFLTHSAHTSRGWQMGVKLLFFVSHALCLIAGMADVVYFKYTGRRTTLSVFREFSNEGNISNILWHELWQHPILLLTTILTLILLWKAYAIPYRKSLFPSLRQQGAKALLPHLLRRMSTLLLVVGMGVFAMRGGYLSGVRPINVATANLFVKQPAEAALVLNTPFTMIRTVGKKPYVVPHFYTPQALAQLYTPLHTPPAHSAQEDTIVPNLKGYNLVILIMESMASEYSAALNPAWKQSSHPRGFTPFLDSLMAQSTTWQHTYSNGRVSIDAMPSVLSSIPKFVESLFVTSATLNRISGVADQLAQQGYTTAFFHGAENTSMGFQAFARSTGYQHYYGRSEYEQEMPHAQQHFDGTWGIWDEEFLQYMAQRIGQLPQPFQATVFTLSAHQPYVVPKRYKQQFPDNAPLPILPCVAYSDFALRCFFDTARQQAWFQHTLFVITADHTSLSSSPSFQSPLGPFRIPIVFYDPSGILRPEVRPGLAQQIDIMPSVLTLLGQQKPFVAFGNDLWRTPADQRWHVAYSNNGVYRFQQNGYVLSFDGQHTLALHHLPTDPLMRKNLMGRHPDVQAQLERKLKAIIQSYMQRMTENKLTADKAATPLLSTKQNH